MSSVSVPVARLSLPRAWWLVAAFLALNLLLVGFGGDLWVADRIYALQGHDWQWRHAFLTESVMHLGGRRFSALAWLLVVAACGASFVDPALRVRRAALAKLALSVLASTSIVALLKRWSEVPCPWSLARYGGDLPYTSLFQAGSHALPAGHCFPAGHASAGYAWLALYFFYAAVRPAWRWHGLAVGLGLGFAFGLAQQLRGAHFLSHDLWAAGICWATASLVDRAWPS
jgi:membrane-associated PAP2 superfamily phosphatase